MVTTDEILVDPDKIKAIIEWPVHKNITEIRSFMGSTGYYRKFIEVFSKITYPITSLQKKGKKFDCNKKFEESFNRLKYLLRTTPIIKLFIHLNIFLYVQTQEKNV